MRAALLALAVASCARAESAKCTMTTGDGRPLLIEHWVETGARSGTTGTRVTTAGNVLRMSGQWVESGRLSSDDTKALVAEIRQRYFALPTEVRSDAEGSTETWTACLDGKKHVVRLVGVPEHADADAFRARFTAITGRAH